MHRKPLVCLLALTTALSLTSCNIDVDRVQKDIKDLGQAVADKIDEEITTPETTPMDTSEAVAEETEFTEAPEETTIATTEETTAVTETTVLVIEEEVDETEPVTEADEEEEDTTPVAIESPEPTEEPEATPEVTQEPAVERVDFSELIELELTTDVVVENEAFREVFEVNEDIQYAEFEGNRSMVVIEAAPNVANSINLMVDGFYQESAGNYGRIVLDKQAELALDENAEIAFTSVLVVNNMTTNGRVITVRMSYSVEEDDEIIEYKEEIYSFDLLTGQLITIDMITDDVETLNEVMLGAFDEELEIVKVTPVFVATTTDYVPLRLVGETADGEQVTTMLDITELGNLMNRFGRTICLI